jgi:hypothetical protein
MSTSVQKLNTGRSAEFADSAGGSAAGFDIASIVKTDGVSTLNPVDGTTLNFTTSRNGVVFLSASGYAQGNHPIPSNSLGINVDGVDYTLSYTAMINGSGGDTNFGQGCAGSIGVPLLAGAHTAYVFVSQSGLGFVASPNNPMTLTVIYPTVTGPQATASPIISQSVDDTTESGGEVLNSGAVGTYADIPGTALTLVLPSAQTVYFSGEGYAFRDDAAGGRQNTQLGLSVDGIDYHGTAADTATTLEFLSCPVTVTKALALAAGSHTIKLRFRRHQAGNAASARILSTADHPIRLTAIYTFPEAIAPVAATPITSLEAENVTDTATTNATTVYAVIPSTLINFSLPGTQTVLFAGLATADVSTDLNAQLGVRIDGVDYNGTCVVHDNIIAVTVDGGIDVTKAVSLAAGAHTAQLVLRRAEGVVAGSARTFNSSLKPSRLTAIYTVPQAITPANEVIAEDDSASDTTASTSLVATGAAVGFTLTASSVARISAFSTGVASGGGNAFQAVAIALNIDGTNYTEQTAYSFANSVGPSLVPMSVFKDIVLAPGPHTVTLMFREVANGSGASGVLSSTHLSVVYHA